MHKFSKVQKIDIRQLAWNRCKNCFSFCSI